MGGGKSCLGGRLAVGWWWAGGLSHKLGDLPPDTIPMVGLWVVNIGIMHVNIHVHVVGAAGVAAAVMLVSIAHVPVDEGQEEERDQNGQHLYLSESLTVTTLSRTEVSLHFTKGRKNTQFIS